MPQETASRAHVNSKSYHDYHPRTQKQTWKEKNVQKYRSVFPSLGEGKNTCVTLTAAINLVHFRGDFSSGRLRRETSVRVLARPALPSAQDDFTKLLIALFA